MLNTPKQVILDIARPHLTFMWNSILNYFPKILNYY